MQRTRNTSPLFILVAMIAVLAALYLAKQILLPIALAVLLTFLLAPLANRIERWRVPRVPAVILVVFVAFSVIGVLGYLVTAQLIELSNDMTSHRRQIAQKLQAFRTVTAKVEEVGKELATSEELNVEPDAIEEARDTDRAKQREAPVRRDRPAAVDASDRAEQAEANRPPIDDDGAVPVKVVSMPPSPLSQIQSWLGPLVAPLTTAGMVFVLVFFMLLDRENQRNRLIQLFGTANLHITTEALHEATHRVGNYLRMLFLINSGYGVAVAIGLGLLGVPGWVMWGVLGFALRFLPYLGPWIAAVLPITVSLAVSPGWTTPIYVMAMYIAYELVLNNVAEPMLYGSSIGVSTVGVIISAIFWTWMWGPVGLVLAMPMTVCLVVLARYTPHLRFVTVLLADQPPLSPAERIYQRLLAFDYHEPIKLSRNYLKDNSLGDLYDNVLIPSLILAERDHYSNLLDEGQVEFIMEAAEDLVDELGELEPKSKPIVHAPDVEPATIDDAAAVDVRQAARVLCVPLFDTGDEIAACMLTQLLRGEGFSVDAGASELLTSEIVDRVAQSECDVVVISVLPPIRPRDSRLLWKRLRQRYPDLPIIVGYWIGSDDKTALPTPENDSASKVVTTLAEAVAQVRTTAAQRQFSKAV